MVEKRVSQIKVHMEAKSTEELLGIWTKNDRAEWSDSAFEAVRLVLEDRHVELPEQNRAKM